MVILPKTSERRFAAALSLAPREGHSPLPLPLQPFFDIIHLLI
jgi:hypothetical protein